MKKKFKILLIIIILIVLLIGGMFVFKRFFSKDNNKKENKVVELKKLDSIDGYSYVLYDNSTELYKDLFSELKKVLEEDNIDSEKYAELISKMFIVDFYTLNTKITNQDIGGLDFVHTKIKENFKSKASDTLYKYIESNVYGDRQQKLPEVSDFVSCIVSIDPYKYNNEEDGISISDEKSYIVKISWKYKEDLGYQSSATIRLVHEDKVLSIVSID